MGNKEYEDFLKWHFENWKLNCAHSDSVDEAKKIYERIYQNDKPIHVAERERGFMAWKAGIAQAVPEGYVLMPKVPSEKMFQAYERYSVAPMSTLSKTGYKAMVEAAGDQNENS